MNLSILTTFVVLLSVNLAFAVSGFHRKLTGHVVAADKAFHDNLLDQLAASRKSHGSGGHTDIFTSPASFAVEANPTFNIYLNSTLPTNPAPPAACANALTATINCNETITLMGISPFVLMDDLSTVCTSTCTSSLASYRANVVTSCKSYTVSTSNVSYPPTYILDTISGPYTAQCLQDPSTFQFCSPLLSSFNSSGDLLSLPTSELCTFCTLETLNVTLSNPATFSLPLLDILTSAVQLCGSPFTIYNVSSPPSIPVSPGESAIFGSNSTAPITNDCALVGRNITTSSATNCASIAAQYSVSYNDVLSSNTFLTSDCSIPANTQLCLPQKCTTYTIKTNDTCQSVATAAQGLTGTKITSTQLQSFNPELGTFCQLMASKIGQTICLTPNGGFPNVSATSVGNPSATPTTKAAIPSPTAPGTTSDCGQYYLVQEGDICNTVALKNGVTLADFLILNPELNANCTNLWLDTYYCVAPFPPFQSTTVPVFTTNYSSATFLSIPLNTAPYTPTLITVELTAAGIPAPTNVAQGTRTVACGYYYDVQANDTLNSIATTVGVDAPDLITWNPELASSAPIIGTALCVRFPTGNYTLPDADVPANVAANTTTSCAQYYTVQNGDSCPSIEAKFGITDVQFIQMNPSINSKCTNILLDVAYCVFPDTPFPPPSGSDIPSNVAPGTITQGCTEYYTVVSGDSCPAIESKFNITSSQFISFNPEISSTCNNLALGEAYCVASSNTTNPNGPPSNVAPGTITTGCTKYYTVVSGDSCSAIESKFSLTLTQFITMNPELNSQCTNLALDEAYCVASDNSTSTGPPSNVAPGTITAGCTQYYTIVSGDSCTAITTKFSLTLAQLLSMNPELNSQCTNLALGEAYCVKSSNGTSSSAPPPSNLASGSLTNCTTYHTIISGDTCSLIETTYKIAAVDFFKWNPEVDIACTKILVEEAYCVAGGGGGCQKVYTVKSGDSCEGIAKSLGISQAQLASLNPKVVDSGCDNLSVGENLCVG